jgi:Prokaryotic E2 family D
MKFIIEIDDNIKNFNEYVTVTQKNGDIVEGVFKMTLNDLIAEIEDATVREEELIETPVLPTNCIKFVWRDINRCIADIYILVPKQRWDITFFETPIPKVGFPRMIFKYSIERKKVHLKTIVAVKDDGPIKKDTPVYHFPFSHVSHDGRVCMGGNTFPDIEEMQQISTFHHLFLGSPFTTDYGAKTTTGKTVNQLFDELSNKDFNDEWLLPILKSSYEQTSQPTKRVVTFGEYFHFE